MRKLFSALLLGAILFVSTGCSYSMLVDSNTPGIENEAKYDGFDQWFTALKNKIEDDKSYHKIDFYSKHDAKWFMTLLFKVWNKNITHEEFVKEGVAAYPENRDTFEYFVKALPKG